MLRNMQCCAADPGSSPPCNGSRLCGAASKRRCTASGTRGHAALAEPASLTSPLAGVAFPASNKIWEISAMPVAIRQLHKHFVGEVSGLDLRQPLTKEEAREVEAGMDKYAVLIFHGQDITDEQQLAFALNFGEREKARGGRGVKK